MDQFKQLTTPLLHSGKVFTGFVPLGKKRIQWINLFYIESVSRNTSTVNFKCNSHQPMLNQSALWFDPHPYKMRAVIHWYLYAMLQHLQRKNKTHFFTSILCPLEGTNTLWSFVVVCLAVITISKCEARLHDSPLRSVSSVIVTLLMQIVIINNDLLLEWGFVSPHIVRITVVSNSIQAVLIWLGLEIKL